MITALYQDDDILIVDKPAGLAAQPGEGVRLSVVDVVERDYGFKPYLVHRLDKETAGCLIVARNPQAAARWSLLIQSRQLHKIYRAVVAGMPAEVTGVFRDTVNSRGAVRSAVTYWTLIGSFSEFSYLELEIETGRTHQIRQHLAVHSLPILGDDKYGDFALNKRLHRETGLKRLLLVAWALTLPDGVVVRSSIPAHVKDFLLRYPDAPMAEAPAPTGFAIKVRDGRFRSGSEA
jgi:23S rRNA pseudouridine955/2504/2580 synthase